MVVVVMPTLTLYMSQVWQTPTKIYSLIEYCNSYLENKIKFDGYDPNLLTKYLNIPSRIMNKEIYII